MCKQFVSEYAKAKHHQDLLQTSVRFLRPVPSSPKKAHAEVRLVHTSKVFTTLHVEFSQDDSACMLDHFTLTDLSVPGPVSASTGWQLSPPPLQTSVDALQAEEDPFWVSYRTPLAKGSIRNAQAYVKFYIPIERQHTNHIDQWVTPDWVDSKRPEGAMWTNELIHFVMDNHFPYWSNHVSKETLGHCRYEDLIAAGMEQRRARQEGRDERIFGDNCGPSGPLEWISTSVSSSVQVKKLLPPEGTKWLFMQTCSCKLENNRLDEQMYLMDMHGDLIAVANDTMQVAPGMSKSEDKKAKI